METNTSIDYDRIFEWLCNSFHSVDKDKVITAHQSETIQFLIEHIDIDILRKIDRLQNPNRCILITGKDENLAKGIASYIYLTQGTKFFEEVDCSGIDKETTLKRFLGKGEYLYDEPLKEYIEDMQDFKEKLHFTTIKRRDFLLEHFVFHWFCFGHTLFLLNLNLNREDHSLWKPLAMKIGDICKYEGHGMLIVSTTNETLPDDFTRLFEPIPLELENQGAPASIPQGNILDMDTKVDKFIRWAKSKFVIIFSIGIFIVSLGAFTKALADIFEFTKHLWSRFSHL